MKPRQTSLLIEEPPLQVLPQLAKVIGLNEAIILQQIHYWLGRSENVRDGRKFVYKTTEDWIEEFPFWSGATVKRTIANLKGRGLIIVTKESEGSWLRTNWYSVDYIALSRIGSNCANALDQSDPMHQVNLIQSIGSNCANRSDQSDPITITTETTSENTTESGRAARGTPMPDGFCVSEAVRAWAVEHGFEKYLELHLAYFVDYTKAKRPVYRDWDAAFRNAVRGDWGSVRRNAQMVERSKAGAQWWSSNQGIEAKGRELGLTAQGNESWADFKARINAKLVEREAA